MDHLAWLLKLVLKAAIFFVLFAFALNNQHDVTVNFFFGANWRGPLVLVVLAVFAAGVALGAVGMAPRWWKHRRGGTGSAASAPPLSAAAPAPTSAASAVSALSPPDSTSVAPSHGL